MAPTRAPMCTATPAMSLPRTSTSPVCNPTLTSIPKARTASRIAHAHDRSSWSIEGGEKAISRGVDFSAAETLQLSTDGAVVSVEDVAPFPVAQLR